MRRLLLLVVIALAAACGDDEEAAPQPTCRQAEDGRVTIVAEGIEWDTDCLDAPVGELTIVVDNRDERDNHNVHLPSAPGSPATDLVLGPSTTELDVTLDAGRYEYVCDIHPNMAGTLTVA